MLSRIEQSKFDSFASVPVATLDRISKELLPAKLKPEQATALSHITQSQGSIKVVTGFAGTGKSFLLTEARKAFEFEGYDVLGACLAGKTAERLQADTGIESSTVASLVFRVEQSLEANRPSPIHSKTVLIVDEAGMLGTRQIDALTKACADAGATLIATGAADQLQPIEAGGMFPKMASQLGDVKLVDIVRQQPDIDPSTGAKDYWKRNAVIQFAKGEAMEALSQYAEKGFVTVEESEDQVIQELAADWSKEGLTDPAENVIFVSTNLQAAKVNRVCQSLRLAAEPNESEFLVKGSQTFHQGDRVLFTEKSKALGIQNGYTGTIKALDTAFQTLHVRLDDNRMISVPLEQYDSVKLGWALTTHKGQGGTFDNVFVLAGGPMQDRHISYVQGSRARLNTRFYTTEQEAGEKLTKLARSMARPRQKQLAHDVDPSSTHSQQQAR